MSRQSTARTMITASEGEIAPGARIGKYDVVHRIASGGMAEIYLARASGLYGFEKYVVLKRILPQYAANAEFIRMFLKEARVAASLDHANIAHVYDIDEVGRDTFFTMEYLHGEDLRHILREFARRGQRLPLEQALVIAIGVASGLHFAHDKRGPDGRTLGIVHRDISPANIVVTYDGGVKVVDFGIAKLATDPELSQRYSLKGKLAYMSAEQLHQEPVDRRSDVFALGVVLYEMTTCTRLFKGATEVETMKAVLDGTVPPPSTRVADYPPALERIVLRALARAPEDRYQSARDLQLDLEEFAHHERLRLSPASLAEWMERSFGPKQELWRTLAAARDVPAAADGSPGADGTVVPTKVLSPPQPPVTLEQATHADPTAQPVAGPPPRPRRRIWLLVPLALALTAAAGGLWRARGGADSGQRTVAKGPVVLVAEQGRVAVERGEVAPLAVSGTPQAEAVPAAVVAGTSSVASQPTATSTRGPGSRRVGHGGTSAGRGDYSAIFARREKDIRRCFVTYPGAASPSTEISLRFEVGGNGHVETVTVLPASVGGAPLGACLAGVGKSTVFPKQAAPLTFRIPLTVHVDAAAKAGR